MKTRVTRHFLLLLLAFAVLLPTCGGGGGGSSAGNGQSAAVSIQDYGAIPNDGQDDSSAINQAANIAKQRGTSLLIPKGTFEYNENLEIHASMEGVGAESILHSTNPDMPNIIFSMRLTSK